MSKNEQPPVTGNDDLVIIPALKILDETKKRDILNKINLIKTISSDNVINSSSKHYNNSNNQAWKN